MILNFLSKCLTFKKPTATLKYNFSTTLLNPYTSLNHSLIKSIYIFKQDQGYCGYIIKDDVNNSLICIDPGQFDIAIEHVKMMETQFNAKLSHVLCTHNFHMTKNVHKFIEHNDSIKILAGGNGDNRSFHNEEAKNKNIIEIGNISVQFIHTPGHSSDSHTIAVNLIKKDSPKLEQPILFTGETLLIGTVGLVDNENYLKMLKSLYELKNFSDEILVFPSKDALIENLLFAKTLDPGNPVINLKIELARQAIENKTHLLPSSIYEEKNCNMFLRTHDNYIQKVIAQTSQALAFKHIKLLETQFLAEHHSQ